MKKTRITAIALAFVFVLAMVIYASSIPALTGETSHKERTLYDGVKYAEINTDASTPIYNQQHINVVTFDLKQRDLYLETMYYNDAAIVGATVGNMIKQYNQNHSDKTAIAAINGDMWMVTYAHARVEGSGTTYQGYSDAVVKKSLTVSRSFNIVDGEIYTTGQIVQETPYAGVPWAFCITDDYVPNLGQPYANITMTDVTLSKTVKVDGINRLPANNAIVMYTDKLMGTYNQFSLDDAYELLIEFDKDYKMCHGANVTGTLKAIYSANDSTNPPKLNNKQMVITVRGNKISSVDSFKVGDKINFTVEIHDALGSDDKWQRAQYSIGGNIVYVKDGVLTGAGIDAGYPTTMLGYDKSGKIVMVTMDGRGKGGVGASSARYQQLIKDLDLYDAFILDGGGSMTMVVASDKTYETYKTVSTSSDGSDRKVNNAFILAFGPERGEQGEFEIIDSTVTMKDPTHVTFPSKSYVRSFVTNPNEAQIGWDSNCLTLTVANKQNDDPYATLSYATAEKKASADKYKYITLVYKMPETNSAGRYTTEIFCQCQNRGAEGGQSVTGQIKRTGKYEYVLLYPGGLSKWKGDITALRLDFFAGVVSSMKDGDTIYIHDIILTENKDDAKEVGVSIAAKLNSGIDDVTDTEPVTEPETDPEETTEEHEIEAGDVNGDGEVNNKDVVALFRFLSGGPGDGLIKSAMDVNEDGFVNNKDVTTLFRRISGAKESE